MWKVISRSNNEAGERLESRLWTNHWPGWIDAGDAVPIPAGKSVAIQCGGERGDAKSEAIDPSE